MCSCLTPAVAEGAVRGCVQPDCVPVAGEPVARGCQVLHKVNACATPGLTPEYEHSDIMQARFDLSAAVVGWFAAAACL